MSSVSSLSSSSSHPPSPYEVSQQILKDTKAAFAKKVVTARERAISSFLWELRDEREKTRKEYSAKYDATASEPDSADKDKMLVNLKAAKGIYLRESLKEIESQIKEFPSSLQPSYDTALGKLGVAALNAEVRKFLSPKDFSAHAAVDRYSAHTMPGVLNKYLANRSSLNLSQILYYARALKWCTAEEHTNSTLTVRMAEEIRTQCRNLTSLNLSPDQRSLQMSPRPTISTEVLNILLQCPKLESLNLENSTLSGEAALACLEDSPLKYLNVNKITFSNPPRVGQGAGQAPPLARPELFASLQFPNLTEFHASGIRDTSIINEFPQFFYACPQLQHLNIQNTVMEYDKFVTIACYCPHLVSLACTDIPGPVTLKRFTKACPNLRNIKAHLIGLEVCNSERHRSIYPHITFSCPE